MNSQQRRQRRFQKQQQRLDKYRRQNSKESKESISPGSSPPNASPFASTMPHPYHPLPTYKQAFNSMSDVTMEDFASAQESVLEYSDTDDDYREEASAYFMQSERSREFASSDFRSAKSREKAASGESAFRKLREKNNKSSRIVKIGSTGRIDNLQFPFEDEFGDEDEDIDERALPRHHAHHRGEQTNIPDFRNWMTNLAYSFRSPQIGKRKSDASGGKRHLTKLSSTTLEYPYSGLTPWSASPSSRSASGAWETSPLMRSAALTYGQPSSGECVSAEKSHPLKDNPVKGSKSQDSAEIEPARGRINRSEATTIAAYFLMDYEGGRPPTLSSHFETITATQIRLYRIHLSWAWRFFGMALAIVFLFAAHTQNVFVTAVLHTYAIIVFFMEIIMREHLYESDQDIGCDHSDSLMVRPLAAFLLILGLESWMWFFLRPDPDVVYPMLISSIFKPLVLFYASSKARDAFEALYRIARIVTRVLIIEIFLILSFAAVACRMFHGYDSFRSLSESWLSLFERKSIHEI